jgi:hypothetical protein
MVLGYGPDSSGLVYVVAVGACEHDTKFRAP